MPDWLFQILIVCGGFAATVLTVKTDVSWIKRMVIQHETSIERLHGRIDDIINGDLENERRKHRST